MSKKNETIEYFTMETVNDEPVVLDPVVSEPVEIPETVIESKVESKYTQLWADKEQIIKDLKLENEVITVFESIAVLKKYISVSSENDLKLENNSEFIQSAAADSAASHIDAQQKALEYAVIANKLVEKYELARLAALELASIALSISEEQRVLAESFEKIDNEHKNKSKKLVVVEKKKKSIFKRMCKKISFL